MMMEIQKHEKLPECKGCEVQYCRYERTKKNVDEEYWFMDMTQEEYEHFRFHHLIVKYKNEWNYKYKTFWVKLCPKHYNMILQKHRDYIMWCEI